MSKIDGFLWFVGALVICGGHALYLQSWRREYRQRQAWWQKYDADSRRRHDEFMRATTSQANVIEWNLDGSRERGQA